VSGVGISTSIARASSGVVGQKWSHGQQVQQAARYDLLGAIDRIFQEVLKEASKTDQDLEVAFNNIIEKINHPISIPIYNFDLDIEKGLAFKGFLKNVTISNWKNTLIDVNTTGFLQKYVITFPNISFAGNYDVRGNISLLPVFGDGLFRLDLYGLQLNLTKMSEKLDDGKISLADVEFHCHLTDCKADISNLYKDADASEAISEKISKILPFIIAEARQPIASYARQFFKLHLLTAF